MREPGRIGREDRALNSGTGSHKYSKIELRGPRRMPMRNEEHEMVTVSPFFVNREIKGRKYVKGEGVVQGNSVG